MKKIILYHGSPNKVILPQYGFGEDKHDYGRGFYLTESVELAKEWAVCRPDERNGWVHKYELDTRDLKVLDFQEYNILSWLAELMKHRDASDSRRKGYGRRTEVRPGSAGISGVVEGAFVVGQKAILPEQLIE